MDVKQKIGVVAISYNEEVDLPGFIDHLKFWVDEIIIVDDGSTDNSYKLALDLEQKFNDTRAFQLSRNFTSHYSISIYPTFLCVFNFIIYHKLVYTAH